jgi:hypothetical protein
VSTLTEFRAAVAASLRADPRLAGVTVFEHGGDYDLHEVKRYASRTPAVIVSLVRAECETDHGGIPLADILTCCMVLTSDKKGLHKDISSMDVSHALLNILCRHPLPDWGLDDLGPPNDVRALNCYNKDIDAEGISLWAVSWCQDVELSPFAPLVSPTDDLNAIHVTYDIAPRDNDAPLGEVPDAEDEIDLK